MRVVIRKALLKGSLQWTQRMFAGAAILLLGYCGFAQVDAWVFQKRASRTLQQLLDKGHNPNTGSLQFTPAKSAPGLPAIAASGLIGRIEIPRLKLSAIVIEGDGS